jgi:YfiR/HmsC-like
MSYSRRLSRSWGLEIRVFSRSALLFVFVLLQAVFPLTGMGQTSVEEYRLKAAFLFHFAQFVEWPLPSSGAPNTPLIFCVAGQDPFQGDLERTVQGKAVAGRSIEVRHIRQAQDGKACQLLFICSNESNRVGEFIAAVRDSPVLTVGESDDFLQQGGIIRFCMDDRKVRFEVNQDASRKAHLRVSSRLLLLAKTVLGQSG